jgi:hypothetical protein
MIDNDVLDFEPFHSVGYVDGLRLKYVGRASYLLAHGQMMQRTADASAEMPGIEDNHELSDYVSKKFDTALKMEPHQMLGSGSRRGGNVAPLPAHTTGGSGTIGSYVFDASKAMVPYSGGSRRSRSTSRSRY